jgi:hypothetical protein
MAEGGIVPVLDGQKPTGPPMSPIEAIAKLKVRVASGTLASSPSPNAARRSLPARAFGWARP